MTSLAERKIAVIGAGLTGQSCVRFAMQQGGQPVVFDTRNARDVSIDATVHWGPIKISALLDFDLIIVSPGVSLSIPAIRSAKEHGIEVIGDIELFCRHTNSRLIAVTGSNGKSTVVTLVDAIFKRANFSAQLVGNIGRPALDALVGDQPDWFILELSSFQLESTHSLNATIAAILNISEDHLDRHGTMADYVNAKYRILQGAQTHIINRDDPLLQSRATGGELTFGLTASDVGMSYDPVDSTIRIDSREFVSMDSCKLKGLHNVLNIQAATLIALRAGINEATIREAVQSFEGIAHRFQTLPTQDNVQWINDSKATNVGAAIASIEAARAHSPHGQLILIAGGDAKGSDLDALGSTIQAQVDYVIALGKDGRQLLQLLSKSVYVDSMQQAVQTAKALCQSGDTVLLAPACASLDMFDDYQHRGDAFVSSVKAVAA